MNNTTLASAVILALGATPVQSAPFSSTGNNFTMLGIGGTNDVVMTWDGTLNTAVTDTNVNMTLSSSSTFFGVEWTAHDIRVFGPGTYTFEACTPTSSNCTPPTPVTMTVGIGQIGAHMLFDWNSATDIDLLNVWDTGTLFDGNMIYPPKDCFSDCGNTTGDFWSGNPDMSWDLSSTDDEGDGLMGIPFSDGPFPAANGSFNLMLMTPANIPPVAHSRGLLIDVDTAGSDNLSASDIDSDPISFSLVTDGSSGSAAVNTDGSFTYTPNAGFSGFDRFTFKASDKDGDSNIATVRVNIGGLFNTVPIANNGSLMVDQDTVGNGILSATDADGDPLVYIRKDDGDLGNARFNPDGSYTYTPNSGVTGIDSFAFIVNDGFNNSTIATVIVAIGVDLPPVNNPPTAPVLTSPDNGATGIDSANTILRWNSSTDADKDAITYQVTYCDNPGFTGCTPTAAANIATPMLFAGIGGASLVFFGLTGVSRRTRFQVATLLIAASLISACASDSSDSPVPAPQPQPQPQPQPETCAAGDTCLQLAGLNAATTYYWKVTASDGTDNADSAVWSFTTK